jgi:hypothetical protein
LRTLIHLQRPKRFKVVSERSTQELVPLAQALFWGEYKDTFDAERSGMLEDGLVKVHLRRWLEDQDAWRLARYLCSPVMQREASRLYKSLQLYQINSTSLISEPDQALPCSFPFEGPTTVQGIFLRLPGSTPDSPRRWLILRIERCSAPFPFDRCKEASIIAKALPFANTARSFANNFWSYNGCSPNSTCIHKFIRCSF